MTAVPSPNKHPPAASAAAATKASNINTADGAFKKVKTEPHTASSSSSSAASSSSQRHSANVAGVHPIAPPAPFPTPPRSMAAAAAARAAVAASTTTTPTLNGAAGGVSTPIAAASTGTAVSPVKPATAASSAFPQPPAIARLHPQPAAAGAAAPDFSSPILAGASGANSYTQSNPFQRTIRAGFSIESDENSFDFLRRSNVRPILTGIPFLDPYLTPTPIEGAAASQALSPKSSGLSPSIGGKLANGDHSSSTPSSLAGIFSSSVAPGLKPGEILEVVGASGVGKTELLYSAALHCAMPILFTERVSHALVQHRSSPPAPRRVDSAIASASASSSSSASTMLDDSPFDSEIYLSSPGFRELRRDVLHRVFVATAETANQFAAVLQQIHSLATCCNTASTSAAIPSGMQSLGEAKSAAARPVAFPLALVVIDNLSAFYWQKRAADGAKHSQSASAATAATAAAAAGVSGGGANSGSFTGQVIPYYDGITRLLTSAMHNHKLPIIVTKPAFFKNAVEENESTGLLTHREYLGQKWRKAVSNYRLIMKPTHELNHFNYQLTTPFLLSTPRSFLVESTAAGLRQFEPINKRAASNATAAAATRPNLLLAAGANSKPPLHSSSTAAASFRI